MKDVRKRQRRVLNIQTVTICISTTLVLVVLGVMLFFFSSARRLSDYVSENLSFSLVFDEGVDEADIQVISEKVQKLPFVSHSVYISKEQILKEQTQELGTDPSEFLGYNPYTSSVEINLKPQYTHPDSIAHIKQVLLKNRKITDVVYHKELVDVVSENIHKINAILLIFAIVMMAISYSLINSMVKLSIFSKRFLLQTMKLVGADWSFIRRPFLMQALWMGVVSGLLAVGVLGGAFALLLQNEPGFAAFMPWSTLALIGGVVLLFGTLITLCCVYLTLNKFLRMRANELLYV